MTLVQWFNAIMALTGVFMAWRCHKLCMAGMKYWESQNAIAERIEAERREERNGVWRYDWLAREIQRLDADS